jgi:hypothetical protein
MKTLNINTLPREIKEEVKEQLTAFTRAYVTYENGQYTFTSALSLDTRIKASDFTTYEFKNTDLYTQEEITEFNKALPDMSW